MVNDFYFLRHFFILKDVLGFFSIRRFIFVGSDWVGDSAWFVGVAISTRVLLDVFFQFSIHNLIGINRHGVGFGIVNAFLKSRLFGFCVGFFGVVASNGDDGCSPSKGDLGDFGAAFLD